MNYPIDEANFELQDHLEFWQRYDALDWARKVTRERPAGRQRIKA